MKTLLTFVYGIFLIIIGVSLILKSIYQIQNENYIYIFFIIIGAWVGLDGVDKLNKSTLWVNYMNAK